jgi:fusion protein PurCD
MRVLLIGNSSGRLDCLADAISRSKKTELFILTNLVNAGLTAKGFVSTGPTDNPEFVADYARTYSHDIPTIAVISNEEPLAAGVADVLNNAGIQTVGPTKQLARIESSKSFARKLISNAGLSFQNPHWDVFAPGEIQRVESLMWGFRDFVIKPDGLTGGKGVKVRGDHFQTVEEGLEYCKEVFATGSNLLIEQKQIGQEFSMMSFSDGNTIIDMPAVQDHKRVMEGDIGPNTGGMGSYSDADHSLPFLTQNDIYNASLSNRRVIAELQKELGQPYKGILYGNYMAVQNSLSIIEFNCRFGDPEVMNVLPLLETDFGDVLWGIATGTLMKEHVRFANRATVCKYLVPEGHPGPSKKGKLDLSQIVEGEHIRCYRGALDGDNLTGSRAAAVVGIADTIYKAEQFAEEAAQKAIGPVFHRRDIGTRELVEKRREQIEWMRKWK